MKRTFKLLSGSVALVLALSGYLFAGMGGGMMGGGRMQGGSTGMDHPGQEPMSGHAPSSGTLSQNTMPHQEQMKAMDQMMQDPAMHSEMMNRVMGNQEMMKEMMNRMVFEPGLMNQMMDQMMTNMGTRNMIVDRVMQDTEMRNRMIQEVQSPKQPKPQHQHPAQP